MLPNLIKILSNISLSCVNIKCGIIIVGAKAQDHTMGLGSRMKIRPCPRRRRGCQKGPRSNSYGPEGV